MDAALLEKEHGTPERLEEVLKEAVKHCPQAEHLWLMAAKEKWMAGDVPSARAILIEAFDANPNSEQIWLAAVKLEWENNEIARARSLLAKARENASTERVWMKAALLEREVGDIEAELKILDEALTRYPTFAKYYMMAGQACDEVLCDLPRAKSYFQMGMKQCPESYVLAILTTRLCEKMQGVSKARSVLELAKLKLPKNEHLWLEAIRLERRHNNAKLAENLMARALQECPNSGVLWAEEVLTCQKSQQKSKSVDALKRCDNNPHVIVSVARLFDKDHKIAKARKWFTRAVTLDPDYGDAWAFYYAFELRHAAESTGDGSSNLAEDVLQRCVAAEPHHGEVWCSVSKQTEYRRKDIATILKRVVEKLLCSSATVGQGSKIGTTD